MSTAQAPHAPGSLAPGASLVHALARNWWLEVLRGVAAIIFGVLAFAWPGITLLTLVFFWGAFAMVDGVLAIIAAVKGGNPMPRWWLVIVGIAGILAGALTFLMPGLTALVLVTFIAVWAIVLGVMEVYGAIKLRKEIEGEWFLILNGVLSVVFGILILWRPGIGALTLVWIIGAYAIILGIIYVFFGLKLQQARAGVGLVRPAGAESRRVLTRWKRRTATADHTQPPPRPAIRPQTPPSLNTVTLATPLIPKVRAMSPSPTPM